jgi:hypothetical protein
MRCIVVGSSRDASIPAALQERSAEFVYPARGLIRTHDEVARDLEIRPVE